MALLLWLLTALVPCLIGMGALCVLYKSRTAQEWSLADCILTGSMIIVGLAEAAHLIAVVMGWSFSHCTKVFVIAVLIVLFLAQAVLLWKRKEWKECYGFRDVSGKRPVQKGNPWKQLLPWILFVAVVIVQAVVVNTMQQVYITGDMTLEAVNSFLESDRVYEVNPLTGGAYEAGMPMRLQILCLPSLYGFISQSMGIETELLIYGLIPGIVLLGSYLAYGTLAKYFFPKEESKRGWFLLTVAVLFSVGDYMYGMDGFGVMHSGFRGVTIRAAILLPYTVGLVLRKKYKLLVLCVLAEACVVWTFYGLGACLLVAVGMLVTDYLIKWFAGRKGREEDAVCRNS